MVADHQSGGAERRVSFLLKGTAAIVALSIAYYVYWGYQQSRAEAQAHAFCESSPIGSDVSRATSRAREMKLLRHGYSEQQALFLAVFPGAIFNAFVCELSVADGKVASRRVFADGD
jgi:hypothetical protein